MNYRLGGNSDARVDDKLIFFHAPKGNDTYFAFNVSLLWFSIYAILSSYLFTGSVFCSTPVGGT